MKIKIVQIEQFIGDDGTKLQKSSSNHGQQNITYSYLTKCVFGFWYSYSCCCLGLGVGLFTAPSSPFVLFLLRAVLVGLVCLFWCFQSCAFLKIVANADYLCSSIAVCTYVCQLGVGLHIQDYVFPLCVNFSFNDTFIVSYLSYFFFIF